jgi:hypothetical protein
MYNIIQSKYRYIFLICILCILINLFINSTKIIEGARGGKPAKPASTAVAAAVAAAAAEAERKKTEAAAAEAERKKAEVAEAERKRIAAAERERERIAAAERERERIAAAEREEQERISSAEREKERIAAAEKERKDALIRGEVNAKLPSLVRGILEKTISETTESQIKTKGLLDTLDSTQQNLDKRITDTNETIRSIVQNYNDQIKAAHENSLSNLNQRYDMYTTSLSNDATVATDKIRELTKNVSENSEKSVQSSNEAKGYADASNRIYEQVFKKQSKDVIDQDNAEYTSGKQGFTSMEYTTPTNLFDLEKDVVDAINGFNTTYYEYVRCLSGGSNCNVGTPVKEEDVIQASEAVSKKANALQAAYSKANPQSTDATFKSTHQSIMNKAKSVDELRRTLDTKMDTILKNKNPPSELTRQYDSTVYTGIMWSVLATSVLFYVFTEM